MSIMADTRVGTAGATQPPAIPTPAYEGDYVLEEDLELECGRVLARPTLHYAVYGKLNAARDNAVLVCHAPGPVVARRVDFQYLVSGSYKIYRPLPE